MSTPTSARTGRHDGGPDVVGRGWAFPGRVTAAGGIGLDDGSGSAESGIRMILSTATGERVMRPDFGCALWDLLFSPIDAGTLGLAEKAVRDALARWEPRVEVEDVTAEPDQDEGLIVLRIGYRVRATNDVRNLVYPFYVIPPQDGAP